MPRQAALPGRCPGAAGLRDAARAPHDRSCRRTHVLPPRARPAHGWTHSWGCQQRASETQAAGRMPGSGQRGPGLGCSKHRQRDLLPGRQTAAAAAHLGSGRLEVGHHRRRRRVLWAQRHAAAHAATAGAHGRLALLVGVLELQPLASVHSSGDPPFQTCRRRCAAPRTRPCAAAVWAAAAPPVAPPAWRVLVRPARSRRPVRCWRGRAAASPSSPARRRPRCRRRCWAQVPGGCCRRACGAGAQTGAARQPPVHRLLLLRAAAGPAWAAGRPAGTCCPRGSAPAQQVIAHWRPPAAPLLPGAAAAGWLRRVRRQGGGSGL